MLRFRVGEKSAVKKQAVTHRTAAALTLYTPVYSSYTHDASGLFMKYLPQA